MLDEVAERIGKSPRTVKMAVKSMRERGIIERVGGKKNGSWVIK
ncbi:MAG: winged helix-turn-helix transcriptional regulator [Clostridiales bacterium]|nr:winged helix-turn-helix transcriptional regulator [Clostridiales bacterium]